MIVSILWARTAENRHFARDFIYTWGKNKKDRYFTQDTPKIVFVVWVNDVVSRHLPKLVPMSRVRKVEKSFLTRDEYLCSG